MTALAHGPLLALTGFLLALAALGWDPALRVLTTSTDPGDGFHFAPRLIDPAVLLVVLLLAAGLLLALAFQLGATWLVLLTPLLLIGVERVVRAVARRHYRRALRAQILTAVAQLAALSSGSAAVLHAFRLVGEGAAWPLREEWAWVDTHVNLPYPVTDGGRVQTRYSDHAFALRRLAAQTPLELHARVLDHLAAIYEQGAEGSAAPRLRQLADVLARQVSVQRDLQTALGKVRGEACIISGAMALIALWLAWSQPARVAAAFVESPVGLPAALWFGFWLVAPVAVALWLTRAPDLPL